MTPPTQAEIASSLRSATVALNEATKLLRGERKKRSRQIGLIVAAILVLGWVAFAGNRNAEEIDRNACLAVNQTRTDIRNVLATVVSSGDREQTPEEEAAMDALFNKLDNGVLSLQECG